MIAKFWSIAAFPAQALHDREQGPVCPALP